MLSLIQRGLWGEDKFIGVVRAAEPLEDWMIVLLSFVFEEGVPKSQDDTIDDWARVALTGFETWLEFWGLAHAPVRVDDRSVPLRAERKALRHLEREARDVDWTGGEPLTSIHRQAAALERFYLANYEHDQFAGDYRRFVKKHVLPGESLTPFDAPMWIADRLKIRDFDGNLEPLAVVGLLAGVSAICRKAIERDSWPDLDADINFLIVRPKYEPALQRAA